jgi:hypothetical protein
MHIQGRRRDERMWFLDKELTMHLNFDETKTDGFNFWLLFNVKNVYNPEFLGQGI